ncbi:MAG: hydroxymethylbilane synthase [Pseudobacteriovorax sp.]|nr:hydroxymethylbilane synthase [Pseudobacteriovorax sp.]
MKKITIASRGSKLALWQANYVADKLKLIGIDSDISVVSTQGDRVQDRFLHEFGGKGVFVRELEQSLAVGTADIAVHSLKDLPATTPEGFTIPAILKRHNPHDAIIFREGVLKNPEKTPKFLSLDHFSKMRHLTIGTSSLRRQSLFKSVGNKFKLHPVRGNVDTRIRKLQEGNWDALILAAASLERLQIDVEHRFIDLEWFVPCAAQGALAIECRKDHPLIPAIKTLSDDRSYMAAQTERMLLQKLGGDCTMPCGIHVTTSPTQTKARALILNYQGKAARAYQQYDQDILSLGGTQIVDDLYAGLMNQNGAKILKEISENTPDLGKI